MAYRLSVKAEADLKDIYVAGVEAFGPDQAERYFLGLERAFAFLAEYPRAARQRYEIRPPVRVHPYRSHLIVYLAEEADIFILRVRHSREDWTSER